MLLFKLSGTFRAVVCTLIITGTQFRRCLDQHLGLRLSESDYEFLADKYDQKKSGRINYRAFSSGLETGGWNLALHYNKEDTRDKQ